jgi:uncharacterized protein YbbC (DUF1343 family)
MIAYDYHGPMRTGLDRILSDSKTRAKLLDGRVGLLAHPASVTHGLVHGATALRESGVRLEIIFGPEHGYGGEAQDMASVGDDRDAEGTLVRSLYGDGLDALSPRPEDLEAIDVLVIDLQDIGSRYYTFVWTAVLAMRACAKADVRVVVLDRPNPLGGEASTLEGRFQRHLSFVGLLPVPVRHSMTIGEICAWRAEEEKLDVDLRIVSCDWQRSDRADAWGRPWVLPSPNMPTLDTALVYPGGCLLEGTNLSDGRGTTRPFEITGAPFVDGHALARRFNALSLPGVVARPLVFRPTFHKHAGLACGGVQLHVIDPSTVRPVETYVALIALAHHAAPDAFRFRTEAYEFVADVPAFDLLTGDAEARERILAKDDPAAIARAVATLRPGEADQLERAMVLAMRVAE